MILIKNTFEEMETEITVGGVDSDGHGGNNKEKRRGKGAEQNRIEKMR